jgi:hypothetical protein
MSRLRRFACALVGGALACGSLYGASLAVISDGAVGAASQDHYTATAGSLRPDARSSGAARTFSAAQVDRYYAHRAQIARTDGGPVEAAPASAFGPAGPQSVPAAATRYPGTPSTLIVGRNNKNTAANGAGGSISPAEPAAINEGLQVFAAGNLSHNEYSTNGGSTWTNVTMPAGPSDAPLVWGDSNIVYDAARALTISSTLYLNSAQTNGVVRIFVRRTAAQATANCSYTIDPAGTANNIVPDYPHLGLSNNSLYLSTNNVGTSWFGSQMRRFGLEEMANCVTTPTALFTFNTGNGAPGQRIFTPAQGGIHSTMYWTSLESTTQIRVWSWPEANAAPTSTLRTVTAYNVGNPDCRGWTNNTDWADSLAATLHGFNLFTALGDGKLFTYWNAAADGSHPQMHLHGAVMNEVGLGVIANTVVWNSTNCIGGPNISTNDRGDVGLSTTFGGKAGGGGAAPQGYVAIDDSFTTGFTYPVLTLVASGTHSTPNGRWGDYFTVRRQTPCGLFFTATNYAFLNGATLSTLNSRYVEFGRGRDEKCYRGWRDKVRTP